MKKMSDRAKSLISQQTTASKKFKEMEELTSISGATWRTWWQKEKPPSAEMLEKMGEIWPQYAFWLVTGLTDGIGGHIGIQHVDEEREPLEYFGSRQIFLSKELKFTNEYFNESRRLSKLIQQRITENFLDRSLTKKEEENLRYIEVMRIKEIERQIELIKNIDINNYEMEQ